MSRVTGIPTYPSYLHMHYHPGRLAVMARLRGLPQPPIENCRLLDIGCGDGTSLLAYGHGLPKSEFVGVDLDPEAITNGKAAAAGLGLSNVYFHAMDATQIGDSFGQFDYIAAHGFYSWVPPFVREKLWDVIQQRLSPNGVVYISFNAYPGSHFREASRRMLEYQTRDCTTAQSVIQQATGFLRFISAEEAGGHLYRQIVREEALAMLERRPEQLFFDELSDNYFPFYLNEFLSHARNAGFEYLGESNYAEMAPHPLPPRMRQVLEGIPDLAERMQYRDFFAGARFHRCLLVRKGRPVQDLDNNVIREFYIASTLEAAPDGSGFRSSRGAVLHPKDPFLIGALSELVHHRPRPLSFEEVFLAAWRAAGGAGDEQKARALLCSSLLELAALDAAEFSMHLADTARVPSDKPVTSPIARLQLRMNADVPSLFGFSGEFKDPIDRKLISLLDGTRDRAALTAALGIDSIDLSNRLQYLAHNGFLMPV